MPENNKPDAIAHYVDEDVALLSLADLPQNAIKQASQAAVAIMGIIEAKPKVITFNSEIYFENEDWVFIGKFYGVTVRIVRDQYVEFGTAKGFEAEAEAVLSSTGQVVGRAFMMCLDDEENWGAVPKYEWKDVLDSEGKKIWEEKLVKGKMKKLPKSERVKVGEVKKPLFQLRSMAQCVPLTSEILTRDGFKRYDELIIGEEVLAYDLESDSCKWTPLRKVSVFEKHPTWNIKSRSLNVRCNADHSWPVRKMVMVDWKTGNPRMVPAQSLIKTKALSFNSTTCSSALVMAAPAESGNFNALTPDEAAVLGWLVCDGTMIKTKAGLRCHIDQSKHPYVSEIRELMTRVGGHRAYEYISNAPPRTFPTGRTYATKQSHRFSIKASTMRALLAKAGINSRADLPRLVTQLNSECRASMLDAMLKAEAHKKHGSGNRTGRTWIFGQKNPHVLEAFQILATLEGRALGLPNVDSDGFTRQTLRSNRHIQLRALKISPYKREDIWCPTTDLGTWVMRQNGQVMITGNTRASSKVLSMIFKFIPVLASKGGRKVSATPAEEASEDFTNTNPREESDRPTRAKRKEPEAPKEERPQDPDCISQTQVTYLYTIASKCKLSHQDVIDELKANFKDKAGNPVDSTRKILKKDFQAALDALDPNFNHHPPKGDAQEEPGANG